MRISANFRTSSQIETINEVGTGNRTVVGTTSSSESYSFEKFLSESDNELDVKHVFVFTHELIVINTKNGLSVNAQLNRPFNGNGRATCTNKLYTNFPEI